MKHTWCIDCSGSMNDDQILTALDKVVEDFSEEDSIILFDNFEAEHISFQEVVKHLLDKTTDALRLRLFKKSTINHSWNMRGGGGAHKAICIAFQFSKKVCLTDGYLIPIDLKKFARIIKISAIGNIIQDLEYRPMKD